MIHDIIEEGDLPRLMSWVTAIPSSLHAVTQNGDSPGDSPLHTACLHNQLQCANYLVSRGSNVHAINDAGETPLHHAAERGWLDLVDFLLFHNANINAACKQYETPIVRSVRHNNIEVTLFLIKKGADTSLFDQGGCTPLMAALCYGNQTMALHMIHAGASIQGSRTDSPLTLAARFHFPVILRTLIKNGALKDKKKCSQAISILLSLAPHPTYSILEYILSNGVSLNIRSRYADLPLNEAVCCTTDYVELLLRHGANPNLQGRNNDTPLIRAVLNNNMPVVDLLLRTRANPNIKNQYGRSPLSIACERGHFEMVQLLVPHCDLSVTLKGGNNYLMCAARSGQVNVAIHLLHFHRYDVRQQNDQNRTAYSISNICGNYDMTVFLKHVEYAQTMTDMDRVDKVEIIYDLWRRMLPPRGKKALDLCLRDYRVDSLACYHALFLNESNLLRKFRAGERVNFSQAPIRTLTRAMGSRPIRSRIVNYLIFKKKPRRIFSELLTHR